MAAAHRTVHGRWLGGMKAVVHAGEFPVHADEPPAAGGTGTAPQPTDLLLAAIASCFTLALAWSAQRRDVELAELEVDVTGRYDGPMFAAFRIVVRAGSPRGVELTRLIEEAQRVCYVTRTLRSPPEIEFVTE
jgi:putative redox protein